MTRSMSSDMRSMTPNTFESDVPPLKRSSAGSVSSV